MKDTTIPPTLDDVKERIASAEARRKVKAVAEALGYDERSAADIIWLLNNAGWRLVNDARR